MYTNTFSVEYAFHYFNFTSFSVTSFASIITRMQENLYFTVTILRLRLRMFTTKFLEKLASQKGKFGLQNG